MIDTFDDLYDQIIQCERRIEEKQRLQSELRSQVQNCKSALQCLQQDCSRLQQELTVKEEQLNALQLEERSLSNRGKVLDTHRDELQQQNSELQQQQISVEEETEEQMTSFCHSVELHADDLDLSSSGQRARQHRATSLLQQLLGEEESLVHELSQYMSHKEALSALEADRHCYQQALWETASTKKEIESCIEMERNRLQQLEEERHHAANIPHSALEFNKLRSELSSLHTGPIEEECSQLQLKVNALQQQIYHHQQQRQQQQYRRQPPPPPPPPQQQQQPLQHLALQETPPPSAHPPALLLPLTDLDREEEEEEGDWGGEGLDGGGQGEVGGAQAGMSSAPQHDVTGDVIGDDDMTLPDLEMTQDELEEISAEGFRVCNRQKPVFKPLHC